METSSLDFGKTRAFLYDRQENLQFPLTASVLGLANIGHSAKLIFFFVTVA
jgi:hypothetical protein